MNQVCIVVNEEKATLEVVLLWPAHAPIGPRLQRHTQMPTIPATGFVEIKAALEAARIWDDWLIVQAGGDPAKDKPKPLPVATKEPEQILETPPPTPKPSPPPPPPPQPHKPEPKQTGFFDL